MPDTDLRKKQNMLRLLEKLQKMDVENAEQLRQILIELFEASGYKTAEFLRKNPNVQISEPGLRKILQKKSMPGIDNFFEIITALDAKMSIDANLKLLLENRRSEEEEEK